jgi:hypothetical protein
VSLRSIVMTLIDRDHELRFTTRALNFERVSLHSEWLSLSRCADVDRVSFRVRLCRSRVLNTRVHCTTNDAETVFRADFVRIECMLVHELPLRDNRARDCNELRSTVTRLQIRKIVDCLSVCSKSR